MRSRACVAVGCPSVCPYIPAVAYGGFAAERRVCGQEISIGSGGRHAATTCAAANAGSAMLTTKLTRLNTDL